MKFLQLLILAATTFVIASCAKSPESIAPSYVSPMSLNGWSCSQLEAEQGRLVRALSTASDAQRQARTNDTVGVILLGLPVSSLSGSNQASNIGRLKGELEAVQKAMIRKGCGGKIIPIESAVKKQKKN